MGSWLIPGRRTWLLAGLALALPAAALAAPAMTDTAMADEIEEEFLFDASLDLNEIDVDVEAGIAELHGTVDSALARRRAENLASTVKGILAVDNDLIVTPNVSRSDRAIQSDVKDALLYDPATESYEVDVVVDDGMVTLTGTVDSWHEKQLSERVAMGVEGVQGVLDRIDIEYESDRLDTEIEAEIEQRMKYDALIGHDGLEVEVDDGRVTLDGHVASLAEKNRAVANAWTAGVSDVDASSLDVAWDTAVEIHFVPPSDIAIADAILDAARVDARVPAEALTVEVSDGVVKLKGRVTDLKARRAAVELAKNTAGVKRVKDRLKVRPQVVPADGSLRSEVEAALARDPIVESDEVITLANDGAITLTGTVDTFAEKAQAEDVAAGVTGVTRIHNDLDVAADATVFTYDAYGYPYAPYVYSWSYYVPESTTLSDAEILDDVRDELWWSPYVDSEQVNVIVDDGMVTLEGKVDSFREFRSAEENAYEGGALAVDNNLVIDYSAMD